jgi:bifunctional non-homologous end joining protein LigD
MRAIAYLDGGLRLITRNDADVTVAYPELAGLGTALGPVPAILDGEIVALDASGRASFSALQPRMHLRDTRQVARLAGLAPVTYQIFDLLYLEDHATTELPYSQRRALTLA